MNTNTNVHYVHVCEIVSLLHKCMLNQFETANDKVIVHIYHFIPSLSRIFYTHGYSFSVENYAFIQFKIVSSWFEKFNKNV